MPRRYTLEQLVEIDRIVDEKAKYFVMRLCDRKKYQMSYLIKNRKEAKKLRALLKPFLKKGQWSVVESVRNAGHYRLVLPYGQTIQDAQQQIKAKLNRLFDKQQRTEVMRYLLRFAKEYGVGIIQTGIYEIANEECHRPALITDEKNGFLAIGVDTDEYIDWDELAEPNKKFQDLLFYFGFVEVKSTYHYQPSSGIQYVVPNQKNYNILVRKIRALQARLFFETELEKLIATNMWDHHIGKIISDYAGASEDCFSRIREEILSTSPKLLLSYQPLGKDFAEGKEKSQSKSINQKPQNKDKLAYKRT